jgi:hypothetical protein
MKWSEIIESDEQDRKTSNKTEWIALQKALPRLGAAIESIKVGNFIYRGVPSTGDQEQDRANAVRFKEQMIKGQRKSKNTTNYYTLIMDNDPQWSKFPPRSASLICSTSSTTAGSYGHSGGTFLMLPEGDPTIGICDKNDLWISFPHMKSILGHYADASDFNYAFGSINHNISIGKVPETWEELTAQLKHIDEAIKENPKVIDKINEYSEIAGNIIKYMPSSPFIDKLRDILNPVKNEFELTKLSGFTTRDYRDREIWFSAPTWMINIEQLSEYYHAGFDVVDFVNWKAGGG